MAGKGNCHKCNANPGDAGWYIFNDQIWCGKCWKAGPGRSPCKNTVVAFEDIGVAVAVKFSAGFLQDRPKRRAR